VTEPRYRRAQGVLFRRYADEILLASVDREGCEGLAGTAAEVWDLLESPRSVAELVGALTPWYQAPSGIIAGDVTALLGDLRDRGFVVETR
jgi:Coenzyme PQQ synthesis protein D (PqqD)